MFQKLEAVETLYSDIEKRLSQQEVVANQPLFQKLSKEHSDLQELVETYQKFKRVRDLHTQNLEIIHDDVSDLKAMAQEENKELDQKLVQMEQQLKVLLLPKDPNDDKNTLLELRAGAGGDEASIFVGDLFRLYSRYAETMGWKVELMDESPGTMGGFKEIIAMIRGEKVYSHLKHESGVHRVQRVPKTETQGRIHTSTVTVAVLPEAEDVEVNIDPNDLRIDVFRSSGPGGQSVNTTDSAVRVTHLPTNLVVVCRDEKSQHKNKSKALKILKTRILDAKQQEQHNKIASERLSQVGTGDRAEKIRTYNYPQGRITDHRIGVTIYQLESYMNGGIQEMLAALIAHYESEALKFHGNAD